MQVDDHDVYKYDEYVHGYDKEVVTADTKIPMKLGWVEGQGLGVSGDSEFWKVSLRWQAVSHLNIRTCRPTPFHVKQNMTGQGSTVWTHG
jgi:hypothetical protein